MVEKIKTTQKRGQLISVLLPLLLRLLLLLLLCRFVSLKKPPDWSQFIFLSFVFFLCLRLYSSLVTEEEKERGAKKKKNENCIWRVYVMTLRLFCFHVSLIWKKKKRELKTLKEGGVPLHTLDAIVYLWGVGGKRSGFKVPLESS